jgi:hypothetical protein
MAHRPIRQNSDREATPASLPAKRNGSDQPVITIHAGNRTEMFTQKVTRAAPLARLAQEWSYILRARSRWAGDAELRKSLGARALDDLERVGIPRAFVQNLASVNNIEVELHDWNPKDADVSQIHEAASEVPWEYLISAGTRAEGRFRSLLISRLFCNGTAAVKPSPPRSVLFVESAPGRLDDVYGFDDEEERIRAAVDATGPHDKRMTILKTPQISELSKEIRKKKWEAIHVTGIDTHQAAWVVKDFYKDFPKKKSDIWMEITKSTDRLYDGMILREGRESERPVLYDKLAEMLVASTPPRIVTLNLYYSGARTARELVRAGAHAALGFLDEIDDELAELFFQAFYWEWCHPKPDVLSIPDAFSSAWDKMRGDGLHGTSIVIWMGRSVFETGGATRKDIRPKSIAKTKEVKK